MLLDIWMFPKTVVPQNGWFILMENPMNKWMIWGENPLFLETPIYPHESSDTLVSPAPFVSWKAMVMASMTRSPVAFWMRPGSPATRSPGKIATQQVFKWKNYSHDF